MLTWTANTVVRGIGPTGVTVLFQVTFNSRGVPQYTPLARVVSVAAQVAEA